MVQVVPLVAGMQSEIELESATGRMGETAKVRKPLFAFTSSMFFCNGRRTIDSGRREAARTNRQRFFEL